MNLIEALIEGGAQDLPIIARSRTKMLVADYFNLCAIAIDVCVIVLFEFTF